MTNSCGGGIMGTTTKTMLKKVGNRIMITEQEQIAEIYELCKSKYTKEQLSHCCRVFKNVIDSPLLDIFDVADMDIIMVIAMGHDLFEDTDCKEEEIEKAIIEYYGVQRTQRAIAVIKFLTRYKGMSYADYITAIRDSKNVFAYIVKLADIKDHLMQTETLTDSLKDRYVKALKILL